MFVTHGAGRRKRNRKWTTKGGWNYKHNQRIASGRNFFFFFLNCKCNAWEIVIYFFSYKINVFCPQTAGAIFAQKRGALLRARTATAFLWLIILNLYLYEMASNLAITFFFLYFHFLNFIFDIFIWKIIDRGPEE